MKKELPITNHESRLPSADGAACSGFTIRRAPHFLGASARGAAMLAVLMFIMVGSIIITAWISLMGARLQQAERLGIEVQRHTIWGNTRAINQQYAFTWAMRDNVTRSLSSATLGGWGGSDADPLQAFQAFRSVTRPSNTVSNSYPFNNIENAPTSDNGVYFARTTADSDSSQTEHLAFYNYFKTYPPSLLGDLLIVHKKPATASTTYYITDNLQVNGRVVIWDSTADVSGVRAETCLNMTKTGTNTTKNTAATPVTLLPENFPASVTTTAGYSASGATAVTDGTLNLANNTDFTAGSVRHIMEATGLAGVTWATCTTNSTSTTNIETDSNNGTSTSATQMELDTTPTYAPPTTSPYNYSSSGGNLNILHVRLKVATLRHLRITNGVEQLWLEGQTTAVDYTAADLLPPVIIWLEQPDCRDIRFIGENSRRLILVTGKGAGATVYCSWHGTSIVSGGPLRWRLNWINEFRIPYLNIGTSGVNVLLTGGIRTDSALNCTDFTSTLRFTLQRETSPGALETLLPRDGWLEPYALVR